jgi:pSer/pThr/pTyr-binding forkhead associated (FHA) protein
MAKSRYRLEVVKGFEEGVVFPLEKEQITLGRAENNDISIPVAEVSRNHAVLTRVDEGFMIKDLGSTNGTFIDRKKIGGKYLLSAGDTVMLGDAVHLVYKAEADMDDTLAATPPAPLKVPEAPDTKPEAEAGAERETAPPPPEPVPPVREEAAPPPPVPAVSKQGVEDIQGEDLEGQEERKTWLWAGIGCLVLVIFVLVLGLIAFDYLNLYCTPPFDTLFDFLYSCP